MAEMKIIIPLAGLGKRFTDQGFSSIKPLIKFDDKTMIEHVINMFPKDSDFIFLCNKNHLENTTLESLLTHLTKNSTIIPVGKDYLEGPLSSSLLSFEFINDDEEIIVNYCDFIQIWNFNEFLEDVRKSNSDGAIVSFKGFHPASLGNTYYCYMKVEKDLITEVREKKAFSIDRKNDFASTGTYYFKSGKFFKEYTKKTIDEKYKVGSEYYVSLPYTFMIEDGLNIKNYEIAKFICLGTPRDFNLYKFWSEFFINQSTKKIEFTSETKIDNSLFLMNTIKKPSSEIGKKIIELSLDNAPASKNVFFVLSAEKQKETPINNTIWAHTDLFLEEDVLSKLRESISPGESLFVNIPPSILYYNQRHLLNLFENNTFDVILLTFSRHEILLREPDNFSYAIIDKCCKIKDIIGNGELPFASPYVNNAVIGTILYRDSEDFFNSLPKNTTTINNFIMSVNQLVNKGKNVGIFEVDKFIRINNKLDYKEYLYWENYFDIKKDHPYKTYS